MSADDRVWGVGEPGRRPCLWQDEGAPWNPDDPFLCRRPATKLVIFNGAAKGVPSCEDCANRAGAEAAGDVSTRTLSGA